MNRINPELIKKKALNLFPQVLISIINEDKTYFPKIIPSNKGSFLDIDVQRKIIEMSKLSYYTEAGLKKLKDELKEMETVQRPAISQQIAEARDKGDLSENAEYDAAKEAQGLLEMKIAKLKEVVSNARIVDESEMDTSRALILSKVKIKNLNNNAEMEYQIVAENEANLKEKKISIDSPIGRGLLGKSVGDIANVETPGGIIKFEIIGVNR